MIPKHPTIRKHRFQKTRPRHEYGDDAKQTNAYPYHTRPKCILHQKPQNTSTNNLRPICMKWYNMIFSQPFWLQFYRIRYRYKPPPKQPTTTNNNQTLQSKIIPTFHTRHHTWFPTQKSASQNTKKSNHNHRMTIMTHHHQINIISWNYPKPTTSFKPIQTFFRKHTKLFPSKQNSIANYNHDSTTLPKKIQPLRMIQIITKQTRNQPTYHQNSQTSNRTRPRKSQNPRSILTSRPIHRSPNFHPLIKNLSSKSF